MISPKECKKEKKRRPTIGRIWYGWVGIPEIRSLGVLSLP
jgi:hypothetical protein